MGRRGVVIAVILRQHSQTQPSLLRHAAQCRVGQGRIQRHQEVQSRILLGDTGPRGQRAAADTGDHRIPLLVIALAHAVQVLFVVPLRHKASQCVLLETGDGAGIEPQLLPKGREQPLRQHHIADADGRRDGLGKCVQIDNAPTLVHGEQCGDGAAYKAELAVVVVLQNVSVRPLLRPVQQLLTAGDGHDNTRGIVVAGRDVYHISVGAFQCRHRQPRAVQRDGHHLRLIAAVDADDLAVPWVLGGVALPAAQQLHQHAVQLLRTGADDDLLRVHRHTPKLPEIGGDGGAQLRCALGRHGVEQAGALL